jgi:anti-sigma B factor antagonist
MPTAAILGCAGYTGQETLDRLLAHPGLEPVALGSDTLSGQPATALDPRLDPSLPSFVSNAEAAGSGADVLFLCLGNEAAAAFQPPADTVVVDLTGVAFLDSTGLGALVEVRTATSNSGGSLPLVCSQERIIKLFAITGLDEVFAIHSNLDEAIASLAK